MKPKCERCKRLVEMKYLGPMTNRAVINRHGQVHYYHDLCYWKLMERVA